MVMSIVSPIHWSLLPIASSYTLPSSTFIQLSFDGALKGNPSKVGYGGILRDEQSHPPHLFAWLAGVTTNNLAEFIEIEKGLQIECRQGFELIHIHGYSQVLIHKMLKNIAGKTKFDFSFNQIE